MKKLSKTELKILLDEFELQSKVNDWYDDNRENYIEVLTISSRTTLMNMQEALDRKSRMKNKENYEGLKFFTPSSLNLLKLHIKNIVNGLRS